MRLRCRRLAATVNGPRPSSSIGRGPRLVGSLLAAALVTLTGCTSTPSTSDAGEAARPQAVGPPHPHWLVTLGDSYISGEGARWAGNSNGGPGPVDALGSDAYGSARRDSEPGCDRARMSVAALGGGSLRGKNLACSGATIASDASGGSFVPGLDWYQDGNGHLSQLVALRRFARHHDVSDIVVSIGGNDFGFGSVLGACVSTFVSTVASHPSYCKDDAKVSAHFSASNAAAISARIAAALTRVEAAMMQAGRSPSSFGIVVDSYPSPLASGKQIRYREALLQRLFVGGCPVFDADAMWANQVVLPTINRAVSDAVASSQLPNLAEVDLTHALQGHRLCETGAHQLQETRPRISSWRSPGAMAQLEWVNELYAKPMPWRIVESFHPNYWGALAERRCIAAAVRGGRARSGSCYDGHFTAD